MKNINYTILNEIHRNHNQITTKRILELGFTRQLVSQYVQAGILIRIRQGVYILPEELSDEMYSISQLSKNIVFSHESALFLNGLSERTPFIHSITIPSNMTQPSSIKLQSICFYIKPEFHEIGLIKKKTTFGNLVPCYNTERTICDLLRSRKRCEEQTVIDAIKFYINSQEKDLLLLSKYAQQFKVEKQLRPYLEVLL